LHARTPALLTLAVAALLIARGSHGQAAAPAPMKSAHVTWNAAAATKDAWGELRAHFEGETYGLRDALAATAVLKPGQQIHPPHQHAEEEFLIVAEGSGEWHLDGKDFPAAKGDAIYAEPWVVHGIKNTGTTPLTFVVMKWNTKGVAIPKARATD
jgi:mannose-6-phosphate isomerase-like protein (cupin superfamily)